MKILLLTSLLLVVVGCGKGSSPSNEDGLEQIAYVSAKNINEKKVQSPSSLEAFQLNVGSQNIIDLRAVGDAGWARNGYPVEHRNSFYESLQSFDPTKEILIGDLSFINWESTLGESCLSTKGDIMSGAYSFISSEQSLLDASDFGFNLFNFTNNHSRDCYKYESSQQSSFKNAEIVSTEILEKHNKRFTWHGLGKNADSRLMPKIKTVNKNGKKVTIAFNAIYSHYHNNPSYCDYYSNCIEDAEVIMKNLQNSKADLKILSIHSQGQVGYNRLSDISADFIKKYDGDVVLGHGAHKLMPVKAIRKNNSDTYGVIFEDLGNFIHPGVRAHERNMLGRVLYDIEKKKIVQIQAITLKGVQGNGVEGFMEASDFKATTIPSNVDWKEAPYSSFDGYGNRLSHSFANL